MVLLWSAPYQIGWASGHQSKSCGRISRPDAWTRQWRWLGGGEMKRWVANHNIISHDMRARIWTWYTRGSCVEARATSEIPCPRGTKQEHSIVSRQPPSPKFEKIIMRWTNHILFSSTKLCDKAHLEKVETMFGTKNHQDKTLTQSW